MNLRFPDARRSFIKSVNSARFRQRAIVLDNPFFKTLQRFLHNRNGVIGGLLILGLLFIASNAQLIAAYDPIKPDVSAAMSPPSPSHILGTDNLGRDIFSRLLYGARSSLLLGIIPILLASVIGIALGLIAGYLGGWLDTGILAVLDILMAFPGILLALAIVATLGPGMINLMIAIGISWIPNYARLTRGSVLVARELLYVDAARSIGCSDSHIVLRHILPNIIAPLIVLATLGIAQAILVGSALSFIGLGIKPPTPEWGTMLSSGRDFIRTAWWMTVFPGIAITTTVIALNLFGDGLRDSLDRSMRG